MNVGLVGLGKMGNAIGYRLVQAGHTVYGVDPDEQMRLDAKQVGITPVDLVEMAKQVSIVWLMVPAGDTVDTVLKALLPHLKKDDIVIDGGNSKYTDSIRRSKQLAKDGIYFLDCGTSGGLAGRGSGFCLMVGGQESAYKKSEPLFKAVAAPGGFARVGESGTGHYVKMIHNGIEYGLLQAYAEGFQLIHEGTFKNEQLNLETISRIWNVSSVIRSWILELLHGVFKKGQSLENISGKVKQTGMGRWTVENAEENKIPIPVIKEAVEVRSRSEKTGGNYATKLVALLRNAFGGHAVEKQ